MLDKPVPAKADTPISRRLSGRVTPVRPLHPKNAQFERWVTPSRTRKLPFLPPGNPSRVVLLLLNKTPSSLEYDGLSISTAIAVRSVQSETTPPPRLVTLAEMARVISPDKLNASEPMEATPLPRAMLVKLLQARKA